MSEVYGYQYVVTARDRFYRGEFIERIVEDAKVGMFMELAKVPYQLFKVQVQYFSKDPTGRKPSEEFHDWKNIGEGLDIIIRMRVEELK